MPVIITKNKNETNKGAMDKLPKTKNKNGNDYKLVKRTTKAALYEMVDPDFPKIKSYEVFQIIVTKPCAIMQKNGDKKGMWYQYPKTEKFPGNEDFGKTAWAYNTLASAEAKYKELM